MRRLIRSYDARKPIRACSGRAATMSQCRLKERAAEARRSTIDFLIAFQLSEGCCGELNLTPKSPSKSYGTTIASQLQYETKLLELLFAFALCACTVSADTCTATEDRGRNPKTYRELSQQ
jgi:hypothetical protein